MSDLDIARLAEALHESGECNNWEPGYRHFDWRTNEVVLETEADMAAHVRSAERIARAYGATEGVPA